MFLTGRATVTTYVLQTRNELFVNFAHRILEHCHFMETNSGKQRQKDKSRFEYVACCYVNSELKYVLSAIQLYIS